MCNIECRRIFSVKKCKNALLFFCKNIALLKTAHKSSRMLSRSQKLLHQYSICKDRSSAILLEKKYLFGVLYLFVLLYLKILSAPKGESYFAFTGRMPHFLLLYRFCPPFKESIVFSAGKPAKKGNCA